MALLGNVVVRRPGEPEVYAETRRPPRAVWPGNPGWGHPPLEDGVRMADEGRDWSQTGACSARRPSGGIRPFSGWTGTASRISSARRRCTAGFTAASVSPARRERRADPHADGRPGITPLPERPACRTDAECHSGGGSLIQLRGLGAVAARPTATLCAVSDQGQFSWFACARTDPIRRTG